MAPRASLNRQSSHSELSGQQIVQGDSLATWTNSCIHWLNGLHLTLHCWFSVWLALLRRKTTQRKQKRRSQPSFIPGFLSRVSSKERRKPALVQIFLVKLHWTKYWSGSTCLGILEARSGGDCLVEDGHLDREEFSGKTVASTKRRWPVRRLWTIN